MVAETASSTPSALRISGLSKRFGNTQALDKVDLEIRAGQIHALVGLNGSGKSTLIKCLSGFYRPDAGVIEVGGVDVSPDDTAATRQQLGLSFMHQDLALVPGMPILDNVRTGQYQTDLGRIRWRAERAFVRAALQRFGIKRDVSELVANLAPWERSVVALIRALQALEHTGGAGLIVLDEPTVSLPRQEVESLFAAVRDVAAAGAGVLFVSHSSEEVLELGDELSVIRDGKISASQTTENLDSARLVNLIVGRELGDLYPAIPSSTGERVLCVRELSGPTIRNVSFDLAAGEVVGLAGIAGAGHDEIPHLLIGAVRPHAGTVHVAGRSLSRPNPRTAHRRGMVLVPADRSGQSAFLGASVRENLTATTVSTYQSPWSRRISVKREQIRTVAKIEQFGVVPVAAEKEFAGLSGGNQQKLVIARMLEGGPKVVMLEEPTQGVDVGAKQKIFDVIQGLVADGVAILYASTEYDDLAHLCDRVLIFRAGELYCELARDQLSKERILEQCYTVPTRPRGI